MLFIIIILHCFKLIYLFLWIEIIIDGAERLTFAVYEDAKEQISDTRQYIGIITAVECIGFVFVCIIDILFFSINLYYSIHYLWLGQDLILFRPFVKKLRAENEHTFSLIRMIPRNLLKNVPEIQEFIQETLDGNDEE